MARNVPGQLVMARGDSANLFELADQAFNAVTGFVVLFAMFDRFQAVDFRGNYGSNVPIDGASRMSSLSYATPAERGEFGSADSST